MGTTFLVKMAHPHRGYPQGGTSISGGPGGLGPGIEFRGKIWGKVQSNSPNKRKNLGSSVTTRCKNWERITILGAFGVISEIQRAKFGVSVTYIFGGKVWGSDMNFRGKIWGQASLTSLYGSTPSGGYPEFWIVLFI